MKEACRTHIYVLGAKSLLVFQSSRIALFGCPSLSLGLVSNYLNRCS
jgi:hypothetical protein